MNVKQALKKLCKGTGTSRADLLLKLDDTLTVDEYEHGTNLSYDFSDGKEPVHVIMAHHDRVKGVPGGNDNGASCAVMMMLATHLYNIQAEVPVLFVWVDNEELLAFGQFDKMGSTHFAKTFNREILSCLVLDVVGIGDTINISSSAKQTEEWLRQYGEFTNFLDEQDVKWSRRRTPPSDNMALKMEDIESLLISVLPEEETDKDVYPKTWTLIHSKLDTAESCSQDTMDHLLEVLCQWCLAKKPISI
jgi:hypothetical protein